MATKMYLLTALIDTQSTDLTGDRRCLSPQPGTTNSGRATTTTVGGTNIQVTNGAGGSNMTWTSPPLMAVTVSGTINPNIWGLESGNPVNSGRGILIERVDNTGAVLSTIVADNAHGTEFTTSAAVNGTWNITPTSTGINEGDRIRVTLKIRNVGTMAAGTATIDHNNATAGGDGDTYVTFTEAIVLRPLPWMGHQVQPLTAQ